MNKVESKFLEYESPIRTYQSLISEEMENHGESFNDLVECTLMAKELRHEIDTSLGSYEIASFTAWTEKRVYFPAMYDGAAWVSSAPRNPGKEAVEPVGNST